MSLNDYYTCKLMLQLFFSKKKKKKERKKERKKKSPTNLTLHIQHSTFQKLPHNFHQTYTQSNIFHLQIVQKGTVYARMAPDQKAQLVESLQELG